MTWWPFILGDVAILIGLTLLLWRHRRPGFGLKPQPKDVLAPETYEQRVQEFNAAVDDYKRKRDANGRFAKR